MMLSSDVLLGKSRGNADDVIQHFNDIPEFVERWYDFVDYVYAIYDLAPKVNLDPAILIAQASHETDKFRSFWWRERLNPAGIGITGTASQNNASRVFKTGREAARAHVAHMLMYTTGTISAPLTPADDPRYADYVAAYGNVAVVRTINDLGGGKWATDPLYVSGIIRHGNAIFPNLPSSQGIVVSKPVVSAENAIFMENGSLWTGATNVVYNGKVYYGKRQKCMTINATNVRKYASLFSDVLRTMQGGETFSTYGWCYGDSFNGENRWWIGDSYGRVWVGATKEKP